jgi:hypothetical protein
MKYYKWQKEIFVIPDLPKLGYDTEDDLYKLIKLTKDEIDDIKNFKIIDN